MLNNLQTNYLSELYMENNVIENKKAIIEKYKNMSFFTQSANAIPAESPEAANASIQANDYAESVEINGNGGENRMTAICEPKATISEAEMQYLCRIDDKMELLHTDARRNSNGGVSIEMSRRKQFTKDLKRCQSKFDDLEKPRKASWEMLFADDDILHISEIADRLQTIKKLDRSRNNHTEMLNIIFKAAWEGYLIEADEKNERNYHFQIAWKLIEKLNETENIESEELCH